MKIQSDRCILFRTDGFTLMELVLATLISSLVIGILAVALSFSLRVWEKRQKYQPPEMVGMLELLKWQLANYDPISIRMEGGSFLVFNGTEHSLSITTDRSVKAISKGAPVVARYVFVPAEKKLYYAEMPIDPYHPKEIQEFTQAKPSKGRSSWPRFYATRAENFSFSYAGEEKETFSELWTDATTIPSSVLVKWRSGERSSVQFMIPNSFFTKSIDKTMQQQQAQGIGG